MERVLVGVFDSRQQLDEACRELKDCEIPEERIHIRAVDESLRSDVLGDRDEEPGIGFFQRLFQGVDDRDDHAGQYAEAVRRGGCVVAVDGIDDSRVDEAVKVMERHGAVDIDERAAKWRERGWKRFDPAAPWLSAAEVEAERRYSEPRSGAAARQMSAQNVGGAGQRTSGRSAQDSMRIPLIEEEPQEGKRGMQPGGVRVYSRAGELKVEEQHLSSQNSAKRAQANRTRKS
jgi:hypothetical protein